MTAARAARITELTSRRVPFVHATVVRAQEPTSARPGDDAIVLSDGSIEGFVGGQCAEGSVRTAALGALVDGKAVLLRVLPEGEVTFPDSPGARVVVNPCLSGGAIEIFLQPQLPAPLVHVVGDTPIAAAVAAVARVLGHEISRGDSPAGATAVIVSSLGRAEEDAIRSALDAGVGYIGLVASPRRGAQVLAAMGLTDDERTRVKTPAGLWIGARTAEEIALSIMAEIVRAMRLDGLASAPVGSEPAVVKPLQVLDPVCGMTVVVGPDTPHLLIDGVDHWFCGTGCRDRFAAQ
jgi:xanthine dehydrogenase accessory factor